MDIQIRFTQIKDKLSKTTICVQIVILNEFPIRMI